MDKESIDQEYSVRDSFGNDPRTGYADKADAMGNPRQFGISIRKDFEIENSPLKLMIRRLVVTHRIVV